MDLLALTNYSIGIYLNMFRKFKRNNSPIPEGLLIAFRNTMRHRGQLMREREARRNAKKYGVQTTLSL